MLRWPLAAPQGLAGAAMPGTRAAACSTHLRDAAKGLLHPCAQLRQLRQQPLPQLAVEQQRLSSIFNGMVLQGCRQGAAWAAASRSGPLSRQAPQQGAADKANTAGTAPKNAVLLAQRRGCATSVLGGCHAGTGSQERQAKAGVRCAQGPVVRSPGTPPSRALPATIACSPGQVTLFFRPAPANASLYSPAPQEAGWQKAGGKPAAKQNGLILHAVLERFSPCCKVARRCLAVDETKTP